MSEALDLLVGVFRSPARAPALRTRELPDGMLEAIRIAAGDAEAIAAARAATPLSEADLGVAASLLLQHLLFFEGADSYRTLGVHRDTDATEIKRHYRWLVRWLHPDRNPDNAVVAFADRITRAWNSLRNPERRAEYDRGLDAAAAPVALSPAVDTSALLRQWTERPRAPWLSARAVRRLPQVLAIVAWAIALGALGLAAWLYSLGPMRPASAPDGDALGRASVESPSIPTVGIAGSLPSPLPEEPRPEPSPAPVPARLETAAPASVATAAVTSVAVAVLPPTRGNATSPAPAPRASLPSKLATATTAAAPTPGPSMLPSHLPAAPSSPEPEDSAPTPNTALAAGSAAGSSTALVAAPEPAPAEIAVPAPPAALSEGEVDDFAARLQQLYAQDRIAPFLALFSPQASGNSGGYDELASDYRRLFQERRQRWLTLSAMRWQIEGDRAVGNGDYEAWVGAAADKPAARTHGHILLELRRGAQGLRILSLRHTVAE